MLQQLRVELILRRSSVVESLGRLKSHVYFQMTAGSEIDELPLANTFIPFTKAI